MIQMLPGGKVQAAPGGSIGEQKQGGLIQEGVRHTVHRAGGPRTPGGEADPRPAQQIALRGCHQGCS
jgi:hypothetical protein